MANDCPDTAKIAPLNLPNMLTYGRIVAVPVVVPACSGRPDFWVRWIGASAIFIVAGITDYLDGYLARAWAAVLARPDARPDRRQAAGRRLPADARRRTARSRLVALGGDHHPVPRDPGLGPARISGRAAGHRAGDALAKWKTTMQLVAIGFLLAGPAGDKISALHDRRSASRCSGSPPLADALHRLGLFPRRRAAHHDE